MWTKCQEDLPDFDEIRHICRTYSERTHRLPMNVFELRKLVKKVNEN